MTLIDLSNPPRKPAQFQPILKVNGLNHFFGEGETRVQILFDIDVEIAPGEIVILTGPSGCGKTTLLTLIGALRTMQDGTLLVQGRDMKNLDKEGLVEARRDIGFIFQRHNLLESLTAYQNVRLSLELKDYSSRQAHERIIELLRELGLHSDDPQKDRTHHKPHQLSGGQRQRVAIARALANRPKLILADEPTAALDEASGAKVMTLLQRLAQEGCTSLIVTHDNRILRLADRIISMFAGRIKSNVLVKESLLICEYLRRCVVFANQTPDALTRLAEKMTTERFLPGAAVIRQGDAGDKFYLIRRGKASVTVDHDGFIEKVAILGEGDFFGERALMTGDPRNATVQAIDDLETYVLGKEDFNQALEASAPFIDQIRRVYSQRQ
jgi:putative ABC transport system ATP-binding protein